MPGTAQGLEIRAPEDHRNKFVMINLGEARQDT